MYLVLFNQNCSSALTAQTTQAIDVELHNVTLAEALKKLENESV